METCSTGERAPWGSWELVEATLDALRYARDRTIQTSSCSFRGATTPSGHSASGKQKRSPEGSGMGRPIRWHTRRTGVERSASVILGPPHSSCLPLGARAMVSVGGLRAAMVVALARRGRSPSRTPLRRACRVVWRGLHYGIRRIPDRLTRHTRAFSAVSGRGVTRCARHVAGRGLRASRASASDLPPHGDPRRVGDRHCRHGARKAAPAHITTYDGTLRGSTRDLDTRRSC